jgi:hypothetical protein
VKTGHKNPTGFLQPLPIPKNNWEVTTIYFIPKFPRTTKQHDSIMVVVNKLTKYALFFPVKMTHIAANIA